MSFAPSLPIEFELKNKITKFTLNLNEFMSNFLIKKLTKQ
jgi:hypothetical protein